MRYAEWCIAAPTLEADIAAAAMGLDDIGHSRVLYGSLRELGTPDVPDEPGTYANVPYLDRPWTDWTAFVAANGVLDNAFTLMIEALAGGNVEVLRSRLKKMLQEERYHAMHGHSWLRESRSAAAVEQARRDAIVWIGPEGGDVDDLHPIDWKAWDPIRRRVSPGGIDELTLAMLQGLAEKRYMPAGA
jgi:ring-1,2-phenylacetyl-CoA epoxidase subunit PaaC